MKIGIWHKFVKEVPRGWPQNGCLFFTVQSGNTIRDLLREINKYRRPEYEIKNLYSKEGTMIDPSNIIQTSDFYV